MILVSYGGGTNSTAELVEMEIRRMMPDVILFADTGGEKPHTYAYVAMFSEWLVDHGMPAIITVKSPNVTLEEMCLKNKCLPSVAYGFKTCSSRFKIEPQDKYMNNLPAAKEHWKGGGKIIKCIGYDYDEPGRAKTYVGDKYINKYPLIEWEMGRDECVKTIERAGLPQPGKSACYFCPNSRKSEIMQLNEQYPDLMKRATQMEHNAELTSIAGLGRSYSWEKLIATDDMFGFPDSNRDMPCGCYDG